MGAQALPGPPGSADLVNVVGAFALTFLRTQSPLMANKYTESTLSVYKLTDINFSQFMYWLLNEYPSVYLLAIKSISVSLCTGYYTNWL